jgi:hypothetical protein
VNLAVFFLDDCHFGYIKKLAKGKRKTLPPTNYHLSQTPRFGNAPTLGLLPNTRGLLPSKRFLKWRMSPDFALDLDLATGYHTATNFREGFEAKNSSELLFRQTHTQ